MNPMLFLIFYRKARLDEIKHTFFKNDISKLTFIPALTKSGSKLLNLLGLGDIEEELLFTITTPDRFDKVIQKNLPLFKKELISNLLPLKLLRIRGISEYQDFSIKEQSMQKVIFIIVDRGQADKVIHLTNQLGASGATIINARGAGIFLDKKFDLEIEPEKEIILIVTNDKMEALIAEEIAKELELDKPNKGILFTLPISDVFGIKKK